MGVPVVLGAPQADGIVPGLLPLLGAAWRCAADLDVTTAGLLGRCALTRPPLDHDGTGLPGMTKTALHREAWPGRGLLLAHDSIQTHYRGDDLNAGAGRPRGVLALVEVDDRSSS